MLCLFVLYLIWCCTLLVQSINTQYNTIQFRTPTGSRDLQSNTGTSYMMIFVRSLYMHSRELPSSVPFESCVKVTSDFLFVVFLSPSTSVSSAFDDRLVTIQILYGGKGDNTLVRALLHNLCFISWLYSYMSCTVCRHQLYFKRETQILNEWDTPWTKFGRYSRHICEIP